MSSMRNAVSRRNHKERSQPEARAKWGLLEKHKDYSLRAKDYNQKKQKLNILSQKSRERHPDEFAFGMLSADKGVQGKHGTGNQNKNRLSLDTVKLLKTQDSGYLRTVAARGRKEIDRLEEQVQLGDIMKIGGTVLERKTVFDETGEPTSKRRRIDLEPMEGARDDKDDTSSVDQMEDVTVGIDESLDNSEKEHIRSRPKSRKQAERERQVSIRLKTEKRRRKLLRERRAAKLVDLKKRQQEILAAASQLEMQRARMARAVGGTNKDGIKFKIRERKR